MRYGITVKHSDGTHVMTTSVRTIESAEAGDELFARLVVGFQAIANHYDEEAPNVVRWVSDSYDTRRAEVKEIACTFVEYELPVMGDEAEDAERIEDEEARDEELDG